MIHPAMELLVERLELLSLRRLIVMVKAEAEAVVAGARVHEGMPSRPGPGYLMAASAGGR